MSEQFSILIDSRSRFETGAPGGAWLSMPATQEQLHAAMRSVGITADNPQDFFVGGFANTEDCPFDVPLAVIQSGSMDELNYLGKLLEMQRDEDKAKFAAAVTLGEYAGNLKDLINLAQNLDCYWIYPTVQSEEDYGYYLIDELDELELPEEAKKYFMYEEYGRDAAINDGGRFTEQGYVYNNKNTFSEWYNGRDIPKEYRIMSYPQPTRLDPEKVEMDAAAMQAAPLTVEPPQPQPVIPINLTAEKPAEKLKEITDRLEQGITELFDSERYKEYLRVMSKFHNYSFNNTLLIAMQKPDASLVAGFTAWKNQFQRNVKKGEKGIKIIAPSPFKIKQETEKIDPQTQKPVIGRDGKPVTEEKEITIPAYKVVSVFDVSQTEGKELPDIAVDALTGDVEQYSDFFAALEKTSPVPIGFEKIEGGAHGYYHLEDKRIALDEGMSELQTLKTAIHEIAHAKLHDIDLNAPKDEQQPRVDRRTREVEAESVAYTVCQHYGLDTSDYSFGYVAGWSSGRELAELKSSLETIRSAAADIINSIDGHIAELQKQHEAEKAAPDLAAVQEAQSEKTDPPLTDLQKKAAAIAEKYEALSTQEKIGVIAQAFGGTAGRIETSPCTGKWRGTSDISIRFDNGASLFLGNRLTPKAKTAAVQRELVNATLLRYNPEIVSATKEAALASLMEREAKDNAIAAQKGLKPYTLLNVEFNDGADSQSSGYMGWYYVTLAVDGNICSHIETGLNYDIADGKVSAEPTREKYFAAGALKDSEVDYVFNNVGFSSASGLYALPVSDAVLQRAEKTLAERTKAQEPDRDSFSIYQLKRGDETRDLRFEPYDRLTAAGHTVDPANYDLIYSAPLVPGTSLKDIFTRFNIDHPKDFKGHSLSVSDVVVLHQNGQDTAHYVDSIGYRQTPEFLQPQNYLKHVEDIVEQNDNNFDGIINNTPQTPSVGELEQKAKAGEPISLIDLANAIHADKERGKEEKPSIRAQLRAAKEQTAQRKAQRSKTQDLERI
jgi:antirestriction protein ArdC